MAEPVPLPAPASRAAPAKGLWRGSDRSLALTTAAVLAVASSLPTVLLAMALAEPPCHPGQDGDCWGAGMGIVLLLPLVPFSWYGILVSAIAAVRARRGLALPRADRDLLAKGLYLFPGGPVAAVLLLLAAQPFGDRAITGKVAAIALVAVVVGWFLCAIGLTRVAFDRRGAAPAA